MKRCAKCGAEKELTEFHRDREKPDGHSSSCAVCRRAQRNASRAANLDAAREWDRKRYAANPDKRKAHAKAWALRRPEYVKEKAAAKRLARLDEIRAYDKARYTGERRAKHLVVAREWYAENRETVRAEQKVWRREHRELHKARNDAWAAANPEKARAIGRASAARYAARKRAVLTVPFRPSDIAARLDAQGSLCVYCGANAAHVDHVKPLALGGPHILANLRPACVRCNCSKCDSPPSVWFAKVQRAQSPLPLP